MRLAPLFLSLALAACLPTRAPETAPAEPDGAGRSDPGAPEGDSAAELPKPAAARTGRRERARLVRRLGRAVARQAAGRELDLDFSILDAPEPNAFATADGSIRVSRGLLALTNTEDELAHLLGHEVAHVVARHHEARRPPPTGSGIGAALQTLASLVRTRPGDIAAYSRDQERAADRLGQRLAQRAGAEPAALVRVLRALDAHERLRRGRRRIPGYLDTHPSLTERAAHASVRAEGAGRAAAEAAGGERGASEPYLERLDGLLLGRNPEAGVRRGAHLVHAGHGYALRIPAGWKRLRVPDALVVQSPRRDANILVQRQPGPSQPDAAARAYRARHGEGWTVTRVERSPLHGLPAHRIVAQVRHAGADYAARFTWVALRGAVYRVEGTAALSSWFGHRDALGRSVSSFRALRAAELRRLRVERLRLVRSRPGEDLAALSERTGNAWSVNRTAVANGLGPTAPLAAGTRVKIARREPYLAPEPSTEGGRAGGR